MALGSLLGIFSTKESGCINATGIYLGEERKKGLPRILNAERSGLAQRVDDLYGALSLK